MNILNKTRSYVGIGLISALAFGASLSGAVIANAQETTDGATMPALYNSAGIEVNNGNTTPLAAGYYYLAPGGQANSEVYYYGNGTFMYESSGLYGGSVSDPDGTAGVTLVYGTMEGTSVPGVPNTGAGGNAPAVWATLILSGMLAAGGLSYLVTRKSTVAGF